MQMLITKSLARVLCEEESTENIRETLNIIKKLESLLESALLYD